VRFQVSLVATGVAKAGGKLFDATFRATIEVSAASAEAAGRVPVEYFASQATWLPTSVDGLGGAFVRGVDVRSIDAESVKIEHVEPVAASAHG
jgi:hypothetical protein